MNYRLMFKVIGNVLRIEALFMMFPLIVSLLYGEGDWRIFLWSVLIAAGAGSALALIRPKDDTLRTRDAFVVAGVSWVLISLFGALPFAFSGYFESFVDCLFESVSGFSTTGSTVLSDVDALPHGILFWRSFTHWIGGMGVLMLMMAVMPTLNASSVNLLKAESTGPSPDKIVPKMRETARIMYLIYLGMTVLLIVLLKIAGLPFFDSVLNAFSVAGTGGLSNTNAGVAGYDNLAAEIIISVFMFLFGINFSLFYLLLGGRFAKLFKDTELKVYVGLVAAAVLVVGINLTKHYGGFGKALRYSSFQVTSIISTTGFATADFNLWPPLSQAILLVLMFTGCCAGSTGGGMKLVRFIILFKAAKTEMSRIFHPTSVESVTVSGKKVSTQIVTKTALFFFLYFVLFLLALLLVCSQGLDMLSGATAVIASLSNVGPGLGAVGPAENYASFTALSKMVLSFCMIAGRLEFYPILVLFLPSVWKRGFVK